MLQEPDFLRAVDAQSDGAGRRSLNVAALCLVARATGSALLTLIGYRLTPTFTEDIAGHPLQGGRASGCGTEIRASSGVMRHIIRSY